MSRLLWCLGVVLLTPAAVAGDAERPASVALELHGYARALSLDLRGRVPTAAEWEALEADGEVTDALVDSWLSEDAFTEQVVVHHRSLWWNTLDIQLLRQRELTESEGVLYLKRLAVDRRGEKNLRCSDRPAEVDSWNTPTDVIEHEGTLDEGVVMVEPWWAPDEVVAVCAFDAQTREVSSAGTDCLGPDADDDSECGCGPGLTWCVGPGERSELVDAMGEELDERVRYLLAEDLTYDELLVGNWGLVNGPLSHLYGELVGLDDSLGSPVAREALPDLDYGDSETWVVVDGAPDSAGALTASGYLMRHQTDRGRASRFYSAFLCTELTPPEGGLDGLDAVDPSPDLTRRKGCADCHARLEPWAAWWGRWDEVGTVFRTEEERPAYLAACAACAADGGDCDGPGEEDCEDHYLVALTHVDQEPYAGWLLSYAYLSPEQQEHPAVGPKGWVDEAMADGRIATCAARQASHWLLDWSEAEQDEVWIETWAQAFIDADHHYSALVRAIVVSDPYRRVR